MAEATGPIPSAWRTTVATILRQGNPGRVLVCRRALQDWEAMFPEDFFEYTLRDTLAEALDNEALAGKRYEMDEPGECYGFIFRHRGRSIYAKINLTQPGLVVIVYSAHRPLHGDELK